MLSFETNQCGKCKLLDADSCMPFRLEEYMPNNGQRLQKIRRGTDLDVEMFEQRAWVISISLVGTS